MWSVYLFDPESCELNVELADRVTRRCTELGVLMLNTGRGTLKIAPPLCIERAALMEGLAVIENVLAEYCASG